VVAFLIRHATIPAQDTLGDRDGISLSEAGRKEAAGLADRLGRVDLAAVFTSPLTRAQETAHAIADTRGLRIITETALREVDVGRWNGRKIEQVSRLDSWKRFHRFRSGARFPDGEMMIEVQTRVVSFLERVSREYGDRSIAVVSHADVLRCAVCHYLGIPLDLALRVRISPASVTTLVLGEDGVELAALNEVP
jgi:probable phosphoglycerate mutase